MLDLIAASLARARQAVRRARTCRASRERVIKARGEERRSRRHLHKGLRSALLPSRGRDGSRLCVTATVRTEAAVGFNSLVVWEEDEGAPPEQWTTGTGRIHGRPVRRGREHSSFRAV